MTLPVFRTKGNKRLLSKDRMSSDSKVNDTKRADGIAVPEGTSTQAPDPLKSILYEKGQ